MARGQSDAQLMGEEGGLLDPIAAFSQGLAHQLELSGIGFLESQFEIAHPAV